VIGNNHKGETLYRWSIYPELVWKGFGDKETHPKYEGDVENGVPNGLGFLIYHNGDKYVGSWEDGKMTGHGTFTWNNGNYFVGEFKDNKMMNGTSYDKDGNITGKRVNGEYTKQ